MRYVLFVIIFFLISSCTEHESLVGYWESEEGNTIHFTENKRVFINDKYCMQYKISEDSLFFYRSDLECIYFELVKYIEEGQLKLKIIESNNYLSQICDDSYRLVDKNKILEETKCESINFPKNEQIDNFIESGLYATEGSNNQHFIEINDSNQLRYEGNNSVYNLICVESGVYKIVIYCDEEVNQNTTEENFLFTMDYLQRLIDYQKQFLIQEKDGMYYVDYVVGDTFKLFKRAPHIQTDSI